MRTPMPVSFSSDSVRSELCKYPCIVGASNNCDCPRSMRPIAIAKVVVTGLSATPFTILFMVLYVAGASR